MKKAHLRAMPKPRKAAIPPSLEISFDLMRIFPRLLKAMARVERVMKRGVARDDEKGVNCVVYGLPTRRLHDKRRNVYNRLKGTMSRVISIRISDALFSRLTSKAASVGLTPSSFVRKLIEDSLKVAQAPPKPPLDLERMVDDVVRKVFLNNPRFSTNKMR